MKRFRFTLLAVCLLLLYLGWTDTALFLRNPAPAEIGIAELEAGNIPREWLHVTGGYEDLTEAISTSGSLEIEAFLVPLKSSPDAQGFKVLVETRDPKVLDLLRTYYFTLESDEAQKAFLQEHAAEFRGVREVTAMVAGGLVTSGNRDRLLQLARQLGMQVPPDVIFLSEGKEPGRWSGFFFLGVGLLGLIKVISQWRRPPAAATEDKA